ncbi:DUF6252 family protein [Hymenobacter sediminicola]|uniref:Lipoprotein n=1 Tax=Hymenobacter sediminicola TaxID=2761579 RepID=A0A7G7W7J4_9BACT|nr:DUF6252 family protein [Hymenobacter sediminicola]QNH62337.1 hypothetical protein H4317_00470 [Hymenobacter sediminicola]
MRHPVYLLLLLSFLLGVSACKKDDPEDKLPPATQTGAGTFGCLVNGQAWLPFGTTGSGSDGIDYDQGLVYIRARRFETDGRNFQSMKLYIDSVARTGRYPLGMPHGQASFHDSRSEDCYLATQEPGTVTEGQLTVTRFDLSAHIISGTFEFTLTKPGCEPLKVTKGRFDYRL